MTATVTLMDWRGPAPTLEELDDEGGRWATVLRYAAEPTAIVVVTLPKRPAVAIAPRSGIVATGVEDAMRYAAVSAVDLAYPAASQAQAEQALRDAGTEPDWEPSTVRVDGHEIPARSRSGPAGTRSLVVTLPDAYVAVAASPDVAFDELAFVTRASA